MNTTVLETLATQQRQTRRRQRTVQQACALVVGILLPAGAGKANLFETPTPAETVAVTTLVTPSRLTLHGPEVPAAFEGLIGPAAVQPPAPVVPVRRATPTRIRRAEQFDPSAYEQAEGVVLEEGIASYYGDEFAGRPTANGEIFEPEGLTAAHRTLPLGSIIRVTNLRNGKSVVLRVNDRGPYAGDRVLDVSHGAAKAIKMAQRGTARIRIEVL